MHTHAYASLLMLYVMLFMKAQNSSLKNELSKIDSGVDTVVLVTGGTGLVGRAVQAMSTVDSRSNEKWIFLGSKDGDLRSMDATKAIFAKHKPTHVLHLAAFVGGLFRNLKYKVDFYRDNVQMNDNVMECCKDYNVRVLLFLFSCLFTDLSIPNSAGSCRACLHAFSQTKLATQLTRQ